MLVSSLVLTGWFLDIASLKSVLPNFISMKFNSAICFLLLGISLLLIDTKKRYPVLVSCLTIVFLIGLLTLIEYICNTDLGIDEWLYKDDTGALFTPFPGRPSAFTSINFMLISFVLLNLRHKKTFIFSWLALGVSFMIALVSCISYVFGNPGIVFIPSLTFVALHTAVLFLVICYGIYETDYFFLTQLSFQRRMMAGFLVMAFGLLMVIYLDTKTGQRSLDASAYELRNNERIALSDKIFSSITSMESGVRGYLLTREKKLLQPFIDREQSLFRYLTALEKSLKDDQTQKIRVDSLRLLITQRIAQFDTEMQFFERSRVVQKNIHEVIVAAPVLMEKIASLLNEIKRVEENQLSIKQLDTQNNIINTNKLVLFFGFCVLAVFITMISFVFRNTNARIRAEGEARQLANTMEEKVDQRTIQLHDANSQLQKLATHLQGIREEERLHLSREVHDELGQLASALKLDIDWLQLNSTDENPKAKARIKNAVYILEILIDATRKIAASLRPAMLDELGLTATLKWQCNQFEKTNGIRCVFTEAFDDTAVPSKTSNELFRICQESLTNITRHAKATQVAVSLISNGAVIELTISDNGKGFDTAIASNHLGLVGMRERALSINGQLTITSSPGEGTTVQVKAVLG